MTLKRPITTQLSIIPLMSHALYGSHHNDTTRI